jgi:bacillithiol system protein YtxJ
MDSKNTVGFDPFMPTAEAFPATHIPLLSNLFDPRFRKAGRPHPHLCTTMQWTTLTAIAQIDAVDQASQHAPVLIFKHSTRCNISSAALARLERAWTSADDQEHSAYYLDLVRHRDVSNAIAERYGVEHASPQVLVIRNGKCVYTESHFSIVYAAVIAQLAA